jgi:hypothetical protein
MKNTIHITFLFAISLLIGCTSKDTIGPQIVDLTAPFNVVTPLAVSNSSPDFSSTTTKITAKFDKNALWKVTISGKTSKAIKVFTGSTPDMSVDWNGVADNLPFFQLEDCIITLSFPNFPDKPAQTTMVTIKGLTDPDQGGIIITNFKNTKFKSGEFKDSTYWWADFTTSMASTNPVSADGNPYCIISGPSQQPNNPYVGFFTIFAIASDKPYNPNWPTNITEPSRLYFNMFVYCSSKDSLFSYKDAALKLEFTEEDGNVGTISLSPNWEGWKIVTINYANLKFLNSKTPQPNKVKKLQITLLATKPPYNVLKVKTAFNHLIWTLDKPYGQ